MVHRIVLAVGVTVIGLWWPAAVVAAPARPDPFVLTQPDGTVLTAVRSGDEFFNWVSVDGRVIQQGPDGFWQYVRIAGGQPSLSENRAGPDPAPHDAARGADLATAWRAARQASGMAPARPRKAPLAASITGPAPTEPLLVILVEFSNRTLMTTESQWFEAFFGTSGKTIRTYYQEASRGKFYFVPAGKLPGQASNGVVRVRLSYAHPNPGSKTGEANEQIARDTLLAADGQVDFAAFDTNKDGALSSNELHITFVVAGYDGGDTAPRIWGHQGWLYDKVAPPTLDGVAVANWYRNGGYVQVGELADTYATSIGPICHELGHDLGMPDLYDLDDSSYGVGTHCLMGNGAWGATAGEASGTTPVLPSAYCRILVGFLSAALVNHSDSHTLVQASDTASSNALKIATSRAGEYFLVENRQPSGFDAGLYAAFLSAADKTEGGGIAIWHVDESVENNDNETRKMVDLEEANEGQAGGSQLDRLVNWGSRQQYYCGSHVTRFDGSTTPNSRQYDGTLTNIAICDVSASGSSMSLTVNQSDRPAVYVSGHIRTAGGAGLAGVILVGLPGTPITDDSGYYTVCVSASWSGTAVPAKEGYTFNPPSRGYSLITAGREAEEYTANARGGGTCPTAGFAPLILGMALLPLLLRSRSRRWDG